MTFAYKHSFFLAGHSLCFFPELTGVIGLQPAASSGVSLDLWDLWISAEKNTYWKSWCLVNRNPYMLWTWDKGLEPIEAWFLAHTLPSCSVSCRLHAVVVFQILGPQAKQFYKDCYLTFLNGLCSLLLNLLIAYACPTEFVPVWQAKFPEDSRTFQSVCQTKERSKDRKIYHF